MSSRGSKHKYEAVPLQEIVVVTQQTRGNDQRLSTPEQKPTTCEQHPTSRNDDEQRPNRQEPEPIVAEQPPNGRISELHVACQELNYDRVVSLLDGGADVNALEEGLTPLDVVGENTPLRHSSPVDSFLLVIEALTTRGGRATTLTTAKYRETPLHVAVSLACDGDQLCRDCTVCDKCVKAIHILAKAGYDKPLQNKEVDGYRQPDYVKGAPKPRYKLIHTALHAAVLKKWLAGVLALLSHNTDVNARVAVTVYKKSGAPEKTRRVETVLHLAVQKQWSEGVQVLIKHGADPGAKLSRFAGGYTPLHMASQRVDSKCLKLLLETQADHNALDARELTPLDVVGEHIANKPLQCFIEVITALIDKGGRPTKLDVKYRQTPVHVAVQLQSPEAIDILYNAGYKKLLLNKAGNTPLHVVANDRSKDLLNVLVPLYKATGLDSKDGLGQTALHIAVARSWLEGVKTLLDNGADIRVKTKKQKTVLHVLPRKRNYVMLKELLKHPDSGQIVNERDSNQHLPLFAAIFARHENCFFLLVPKADLTFRHGNNKSTVLHIAIQARQPNILNKLFEQDKTGMDKLKECTISTKLLKNATPLHMAAFWNLPECVAILVKHGCDRRAKTEYESKWFTAFELATMKGYDRVVKELVNGDSKQVNEPHSMGMMPIHWACIHHHSKVIKVMVDAGCDLSAQCSREGDYSRVTSMDLFVNRVPGAVDLLEEMLDSSITVNKERIEFDYKILLPEVKDEEECKQLKVIDALVQTGDQVNQSRLFTHPVVETFLRLQWERMRNVYILFIGVFTLFLVVPFNFLLITVFYFDNNPSDVPVWATILLLSIAFGVIIYVCHEGLSVIVKTRNSRYFRQWQLSKEVMMFLLKTLIWILKIILIPIIVFLPFTNPQATFYRELATCALILLWLEFMLFASRVPTYGIYMLMFFEVTSNFFVIMLSFTFLVLGFVTTFLVEYHGQVPFSSIGEAILKTLVMMTSEFDYETLFDNVNQNTVAFTFSNVVFLIFLLIVSIVVMNIVLAKAILDVKKVDRLRQQAKFLTTYEQLILFSNFTFMKTPEVDKKLYIRFDEANRFHTTLTQSIMERAFIITKTRQDDPKEDQTNKKVKVKRNEFNIQLNELMEMNKMMMENINNLSKKLDMYTQRVDSNNAVMDLPITPQQSTPKK